MGTMSRLAEADDKEICWDPNIPEEVAVARARFEHYLKEGYIACRIEKGGRKGVHISEFDPMAEEILLVSIVEGG